MCQTNRKIHIAHIIDQLGIGGTEKQLKLLLDGLDKDKFKLSLFVLRGSTDYPTKPENADIRNLNVNSLISIHTAKKLLKFIKILQRENYDILQTFFQDATFFGVLAAKMAGIKVIVSIRDMMFWANRWNLIAYKATTLMADQILVNSFAVRELVKPLLWNKRIHVIHNGIEITNGTIDRKEAKRRLKNELGLIEDWPVVTLISNCNRKVKRVDLFIESIPFVLKKASAYFLIVGDGHLRHMLESRAQNLGVGRYVRFTGHRKDVDMILLGSDIAVNTSDSEGLSNSVLEAMQAGLTVIASDVPGNKELINHGENGILFKRGKKSLLATNLIKLINGDCLLKRLGVEAKNTIMYNYSAKSMLEKHMRLYQNSGKG